MNNPKYQVAGSSVTTPLDNTRRKEVTIASPTLYSALADLSDLIGMDPDTRQAVEAWPFEFRNEVGETLLKGVTDMQGDTARLFMRKKETVRLYVNDGEWKLSMDGTHDEHFTDVSTNEMPQMPDVERETAALHLSILDTHGAPIPNLEFKVLVRQQVVSKGTSDNQGKISPIKGLKLGSVFEVRIKKDKSGKGADAEGYKFAAIGKIECIESYACLESPRVMFEFSTELHHGVSGNASREKEKTIDSHNQKPTETSAISGNPDKRPELQMSRDDKGGPVTRITSGLTDWFGRNRVNVGAPDVDKDGLERVNLLIEFGKEQVSWEYPDAASAVHIKKMMAKTFQIPQTKPESKSLGWCNRYVKIALWRAGYGSAMEEVGPGISSAADMGPALLKAGFKDVTAELLDARWAAPGDVIVYKWSNEHWVNQRARKRNERLPNYGHIDIRTYDGYMSDFFTTRLPNPYNYEVIGIYRKFHDPLPERRMKAFLRSIQSLETKGIPEEKSWYALNTSIDGNKFAHDLSTHPWLGVALPESILKNKSSTASGAYQITLGTWKSTVEECNLKKDFSREAQIRVAGARLEIRGALKYVRVGDIDSSIKLLFREWDVLSFKKSPVEDANKFKESYFQFLESK